MSKIVEDIQNLERQIELRDEELRKAKKQLCEMFGHPRVITSCFGYIHCARCDEQIGDALGGYFDGDKYVIIDHDCEKCRANWTRLEENEKLLVPDPFPKNEETKEDGRSSSTN